MENCSLGANGAFTVTGWEPLCLTTMRDVVAPEMMGGKSSSYILQAASTQDHPPLPLRTMEGRAANSRVCSAPVPTLLCLPSLLPVTAAALAPPWDSPEPPKPSQPPQALPGTSAYVAKTWELTEVLSLSLRVQAAFVVSL